MNVKLRTKLPLKRGKEVLENRQQDFGVHSMLTLIARLP